jgi:hypothetical protein
MTPQSQLTNKFWRGDDFTEVAAAEAAGVGCVVQIIEANTLGLPLWC